MNIGILASGEGTTLQRILDACFDGRIAAHVSVVISNSSRSGALAKARAAGVRTVHLSSHTHPHAEALDAAIRDTLLGASTNLVFLAGYVKRVGPATLATFSGRVLNTHPALLPRFGGQGMYGDRVFEAVLESGDDESGVSVHLVDPEYDAGVVIAQSRVPVMRGESLEALRARVQEREREFVVDTLAAVARGELSLNGLAGVDLGVNATARTVSRSNTALAHLTRAQRDALAYSAEVAASRETRALEAVRGYLDGAEVSVEAFNAALESLQRHGRVVLHFHPDRLTAHAMTVAEGLLADGIYRNQFETGVTGGSRSARPGGERDVWEQVVFGGAYHSGDVPSTERPRYGSFELVRFPDGPIPRFGSCYFVLRPSVSARSTFTFMGTEDPRAPERLGTISHLHTVMAPLLAEIVSGAHAEPAWPPFRTPTLGVPGLTVNKLIDLLQRLADARADPRDGPAGRVLDTTVEAQVHDIVDLRRDVEWLVADPAFTATPTGDVLTEIGARYGFPIRWHCGFQMRAADVPDNFRGPAMPALARRIARDGRIDAEIIGAALASLRRRPETWLDWGPEPETWQQLKQLWHVVVHFGSSRRVSSGSAG